MKNRKKIIVLLSIVVLLPVLFYSAYQISTLNETEEMIQQVYYRQLDAILFSVNQYVLDVASSWANRIENEQGGKKLAEFLHSNRSIVSIISADSSLNIIRTIPAQHASSKDFFQKHQETIERLLRYQSIGYRKLEPVAVTDSTIEILFVCTTLPARVYIMQINDLEFVNDIIGKKLNDVSQNEFELTVSRIKTGSILFSTSSPSRPPSVQKQLWIFPDYSLGIRVKGETLNETARSRYHKNLFFLIILDVVLIGGAIIIYRTINREMELAALRTDFVSNVSHELRTPLSLIRMFAETLEMKRVKTEKKKQEYYGIILQETERLTRLINNILNFSRMESDTRKFQFRENSINEIIQSVIKVYSFHLESKGFTVALQLDEKIPPAMVDDEAVSEALHNLLDNAIKYSGEEKYLRITTRRNENSIIIEVEDHGIGILKEHHEKIFQKFYRVSQGLVHTAKGSGLGLTLVHHIVTAHHGTIDVRSSEGKGSTFIITLPMKRT